MQVGSPSSSNGITNGFALVQSPWGEYNNIIFAIAQALSKMQTATLVQVKACTNSGGLSPVGYLDAVPMVNQIDAQGNPTPHTTIYNLPYLRIQGGSNAVIIDPQPGDIGIAIFASRDISKVKNTKKPGNPGSARQYSFSDGLYLGGVLNGTPSQYVQFNASGITINSPNKVTVNAPEVDVVASSVANVTAPAINLGASGQTLLALVTSAFESIYNGHTHNDPQGGTTGGPNQPMTSGHLTTTIKGG